VTFIEPSTTGCLTHCTWECDVWSQDCAEGEKCNPWANDGGSAWNATKCVPVDPDPNQPGEPCTVEGSGVSGIDDCDLGSMCFWVDVETNMGTCVAMCTGSAAAPECPDACDECMIANDGVLTLCLDSCDPLTQDCGEGRGCYPNLSGDQFVCFPQIAMPVAVAEPCTFLTDCAPGSVCLTPEYVSGCPPETGCCAALCDFFAADPCAGALSGPECMPWWSDEPPGNECISWANVGVCVEAP
jgi:hypothetical protein